MKFTNTKSDYIFAENVLADSEVAVEAKVTTLESLFLSADQLSREDQER